MCERVSFRPPCFCKRAVQSKVTVFEWKQEKRMGKGDRRAGEEGRERETEIGILRLFSRFIPTFRGIILNALTDHSSVLVLCCVNDKWILRLVLHRIS